MATIPSTSSISPAPGAVLAQIGAAIEGEVRSDRLSRTLYATDASIYEIVPDAVVLPRTHDDVVQTVRVCAQHGVPITARGAGTGLTGATVNRGIQLDCSRFLNRILDIDVEARTATVEAGVVLDELNAALQPHGLYFAPDPATSNRATIGGTIANNSCGSHSVVIGRTSDHLVSITAVLADGSTTTWGDGAPAGEEASLARRCEAVLADVKTECAAEIAERYPDILRKNGGYALDRLRLDQGNINPEQVICGSEGTLCIVTSAKVKLTPIPRHKGLVVVHFSELLDALSAVPALLEHAPAAIELIDKFILDAARANPLMERRSRFLDGDPAAVLVFEIHAQDAPTVRRRLTDVAEDLTRRAIGYASPVIVDVARQADVWEMRKAGLGLLMSRPGDRQPVAFVEDAAVPPARLREYIERFSAVLAEEGVDQAGYYAHASVGLLHVRPVLNLKLGDDVARMQRIADRVSSLALEFGGTMTGEHGDGIVRSAWLEKMYGPRIIEAFRKIKGTFDPQNIFNPGKIVDPLPMTENLRYGADFESTTPVTMLDFGEHGMAGLAGMCSGVGQCRQRLVGAMCPSYMATGDETHTTRARANALRVALSNRGLLDGLADPALDEVFDLCISCKACKTECPTGTDVAKLKAEWLFARHRRLGVPARSRLIAKSVEMAAWGSRFAPLSNWVMQSKLMRALLERVYGLDRRVPPPRFVRRTFQKWFARHRKDRADERSPDKPKVVYFADTWTNYYQPNVGIAAVKVLEALGYDVIVPRTNCCGRPLISKGMLAEARLLAVGNVEALTPFADRQIPIVGTEPSCVSALVDEYPQLVRNQDAQRIAGVALNIESLVARHLEEDANALRFRSAPRVIYHGHCHQKALTGTSDALALLTAASQDRASEINSGCCGMAGSFGHEVEHYDVARAIGEQRLFPAVRERGDADVIVSGFSCRHQLEHHTQVHPRHVIEYVADALAESDYPA